MRKQGNPISNLIKKHELCLSEVVCMEYCLTTKGVWQDPAKIKAIVESPSPKKWKGGRALTRLCNVPLMILSQLEKIVQPIRQLIEKNVASSASLHNRVKRCLMDATIIRYYGAKEVANMQCNASQKGLGATYLATKRTADGLYFQKSTVVIAAPCKNRCLIVFPCDAVISAYMIGRALHLQ